MGVVFSNAAMCVKAKQEGVRFCRTLTIGHLDSFLSEKEIRVLANHAGRTVDAAALSREKFVDRFCKEVLDADEVLSLDVSDYERCDIVHDMNQPIDEQLHQSFDVVIDGGTLEHVFNFPVAIANCMNLLKQGGSLFVIAPSNNHLGHGFYQFSPELFYRVLSESNGFEVREMLLEQHPFPGREKSSRTKLYSVADPEVLRARVKLVSRSPALILVHAVRTKIKPILETYPIQSDYVTKHADQPISLLSVDSGPRKMLRSLSHAMPHLRNYITGKRQLRKCSYANKRFYKKWRPFE